MSLVLDLKSETEHELSLVLKRMVNELNKGKAITKVIENQINF